MNRLFLPALAALTLSLTACVAPPTATPTASPAHQSTTSGQLELKLASGSYRCEDGIRVQVDREIHDQVNHRIKIAWNGTSYRLERDPSYSGLPRFADSASGLVWIDLPWKSVLLDGRTNKPLANECRYA